MPRTAPGSRPTTRCPINGLTFDGKVGAVPLQDGHRLLLLQQAELFTKAGVDAAQIKTWDDFLGAVKKLKDAGIVPIAGGGGEKWPIHFYWSYLVHARRRPEGLRCRQDRQG